MVHLRALSWLPIAFCVATHSTPVELTPSPEGRNFNRKILRQRKFQRSMKTKSVQWLLLLVLGSLLLSACTGTAAGSQSWPGVTADQDTIYLAYANYVAAVRPTDGSLIWRYPAEAENARTYFAAPTVADGRLFVGDYLNTLHSVDAKTGAPLWSKSQGTGVARMVGSAVVVEDLVMIPSTNHFLYAFDLDGLSKWSFEAKNGLWATPVSDGTKVYVPSMDHFLYALNIENGKEVWSVDLGAPLLGSAYVSEDGKLYIGTLTNELVALNAADGKELWRITLAGQVWAAPTVLEGTLIVGDVSGAVYGLNPENGQEIWKNGAVGGAITGYPAVIPNAIVFATDQGNLVALNSSGTVVWTQLVKGKLYGSPLVIGDRIIVGISQGEGVLKAFDFNGGERWKYDYQK